MEENNQFRDRINLRNADLSDNWWPFVENVNEILERMVEIENIVADLDNKIGESFGLGRSITKALYKLGLYDKEYKLNWPMVKVMTHVLEKAEEEVKENERKERESDNTGDESSGTV